MKFAMFKYNDLQGIAGFFSGNVPVLKFIISQARMNQKNSTFHLHNYFHFSVFPWKVSLHNKENGNSLQTLNTTAQLYCKNI